MNRTFAMKREYGRHVHAVTPTTSGSESRILRACNPGANCYITEPLGPGQFTRMVET